MLDLAIPGWLDLAQTHNGLDREFNFFKELEGGACTMCAPRDQRESREKLTGQPFEFEPRISPSSTNTSLSSSDFVPWLFLFIVALKQFEQALAHDHPRPIRWHVFFDLPAHVHDGIRVG